MKLPSHDQASGIISADESDAVAQLIYDNEPANRDEAALFRRQVAAALNMAVELGRMDSRLKFESDNED